MNFKKLLLSSGLALSALGFASDEIDRCVTRIRKVCSFNRAEANILYNAKSCKQFSSGSGKTTLQSLVTETGDIYTVETAGSSPCETKITRFAESILEQKVVPSWNRVFYVTSGGRVLFMVGDGTVNELMNGDGKPYSSVDDVIGSSNGKSLTISFKNGNKDHTFDEKAFKARDTKRLTTSINGRNEFVPGAHRQ